VNRWRGQPRNLAWRGIRRVHRFPLPLILLLSLKPRHAMNGNSKRNVLRLKSGSCYKWNIVAAANSPNSQHVWRVSWVESTLHIICVKLINFTRIKMKFRRMTWCGLRVGSRVLPATDMGGRIPRSAPRAERDAPHHDAMAQPVPLPRLRGTPARSSLRGQQMPS